MNNAARPLRREKTPEYSVLPVMSAAAISFAARPARVKETASRAGRHILQRTRRRQQAPLVRSTSSVPLRLSSAVTRNTSSPLKQDRLTETARKAVSSGTSGFAARKFAASGNTSGTDRQIISHRQRLSRMASFFRREREISTVSLL